MALIISIYGKGGIGKSTTTSNLAAAFSRRGKTVLQIGCDPKHDSTFPITHCLIPTVTEVLDKYNFNYDSITPEEIIHRGYGGIAAVESGGPVAGVGCAGYVVGETIQLLEELGTFDDFDVVLFDVLGDVVCGGFSVPLKHSNYAIIVAANDFDSLFAANRIASAVVEKGKSYPVKFAGIIGNRCCDVSLIEKLLVKLNSNLITTIKDHKIIYDSRLMGRTLFEMAEENPAIEKLTQPYLDAADYLLKMPKIGEVKPLPDRDVFKLLTSMEFKE